MPIDYWTDTMKKLLFLCVLAATSAVAVAGDGYELKNSQNIMHFVQLDEGKATDIDTYKAAINDICATHEKCQVIFWADNTPMTFPFSKEQNRARTAYYQTNKKKGETNLYVDCKLFAEIEDAECL